MKFKHLIHSYGNIKKYGEVFTPYDLSEEMIQLIYKHDIDFFKNKHIKILEPCCGKLQITFNLIDHLMENLNDIIIDEKERYNHILTNILYLNEFSNENNEYIKFLFRHDTINLDEGDFLRNDMIYEDMKFDLIIINPPYNQLNMKYRGTSIWQNFIKKCLKLLKPNGIFLCVTPSTWRSHHLYTKKTDRNLVDYLN